MAIKKPAGPVDPVVAVTDTTEPVDLNGKVAAALDGQADYVYVEVRHDGQVFVAWRSRNGDVHIENRGT